MIGYNQGWGKFQNDHCCCFGKFKKVVFNSCRYDGKQIVFRFKTENDIFPFSVAITSLIQVLVQVLVPIDWKSNYYESSFT